ncbi:MAG TPA: TIGR04084 family radical SAM/SPASM domain-containing protein, partial [Methanomicrobiales archaeon]|nr:TIGR04084 family radical SAM/SPASM domain-containing protein [Methanomicrobiales archaeon]
DIDPDLPVDLAYDPELLYRFLEKDPGAALIFYGGEPLLRADLVSEMVRHAPAKRFLVQTNGLLLDRLPRTIVNRLDSLLVSIDGPPGVTDASRGEGTYDRVMANLAKIVAGGYRGEIIARMTVTERTDIAGAVRFLAGNGEFPFTSIHWQLDADLASDAGSRSFASWAGRSYNPGIRTLIHDWVDRIEDTGVVPRWYPFIDPMEDLLAGRESRLRCGAGHANFTIMTDGSIGPCPCMVGMRDFYLGHIRTSGPGDLPPVPETGSFCSGCDIRSFCGGRCLYARVLRPWPEDLERVVCGTVKNLHQGLTGALPRVRDLLGRGTITLADFAHPRYNGCEIIP